MLGLVAFASVSSLERQIEDTPTGDVDPPSDPTQSPDDLIDAPPVAVPLDGRIEVRPATVDFEDVTPGEHAPRWIDIDNSGPGVLTVRDVEILGDDVGAFALIVGIPQRVRIVNGYEPPRSVGMHRVQALRSASAQHCTRGDPLTTSVGEP